ncbi:MAG: ATP-binding cassette domain-containing protein [Planctomycetota bacterium]|nr:ATP-binding cassette domain-containing protein [Planctomycetota bacterium]
MTKSDSILTVSNVTVTFSRWGQAVRAVRDLTLSLPRGQWVMLVGHNGSGKSTLLRAISGAIRPETGDIVLTGRSLTDMSASEIARSVFLVHQDPLMGTASTLTLFENLLVADHAAATANCSHKELLGKYVELLRPLGLADRLKQLAKTLSGGERQLLALLIGRLRPSPLMLLDEPLAALDPAKSELCIEQIRSMHAAGKTVVQVTHEPHLALRAGDRTVVLANGEIVYDAIGDDRSSEALRRFWGGV